MKQNRAKVHLTVVKEQTQTVPTEGTVADSPVRPSDIIAIENLSSDQTELARRYLKQFELKGVMVGALQGDAEWDIRPIIIMNSKLAVLRVSDPAWAIDRSKINLLRNIYSGATSSTATSNAQSKELLKTVLQYGEVNGQIWVLRYFHQSILRKNSKNNLFLKTLHPVQVAQQLIAQLDSMHKDGLIHGHICLSNIGTDDDSPAFLDFGFGALKRYHDLAPEILNKQAPSPSSDIYGLGKVLKVLLEENLTTKHHDFIGNMLQQDPALRPSITQVKEAFFVEGTSGSNSEGVVPNITLPVSNIPISNLTAKIPAGTFINTSKTVAQVTQPPTKDKQERQSAHEEFLRRPTVVMQRPNLFMPTEAIVPERKYSEPKHTQPKPAIPSGHELNINLIDIVTPKEKVRRANLIQSDAQNRVASKSTISNARIFLFVAMFTALVSLAIGVAIFVMRPAKPPVDTIDYSAYWASAQPVLQHKVIEAAVINKDLLAQKTIIESARSNAQLVGFRRDMIKVAFNDLWADSLTQKDKQIIFALSLDNLDRSILTALPPINGASAPVIIAILSQIEGEEPSLADLPLNKLFALPQPFGAAFKQLNQLGVKSVGQPEARALINLIVGKLSSDTLERFINHSPQGKIQILLSLIEAYGQNFADEVLKALSQIELGIIPEIDWLNSPSDINWQEIPSIPKLHLASGQENFNGLSLEHELDLLSFPNRKVRQAVAQKIENNIGSKIKPVLKVLGDHPFKLTRSQVATLISALSYKGEYERSYIALWFSSNPDPQMVLNLLMARNSDVKNDFFNLEASRYLADKEWDADFKTLMQMGVHLEPVARALAYSKMDPAIPEHLRFLRKMSNIEPSNIVRKGILDKIKIYEPKSTLRYHPVAE